VPDRLSPNDIEQLNRSKKRKRELSLTHEQRQRLRAVLKNLRHGHGTWKRVAAITGISLNTLYGVSKGLDFGS
jgi:hypothetical protein